MNDDQIVEALRSFWQFHPDARIDVERKGEHLFRVTEVKPDLSIGKRVVAYRHEIGGVVSCLEPDLTFEQARVYDLVLSGFAKRRLREETNRQKR